ncbi:MAG: hypothetical protein F6K50_03975 [Moorea sp. SIO3I7]|nr:hypothetical protein [Moorena sp. SIO3I7]
MEDKTIDYDRLATQSFGCAIAFFFLFFVFVFGIALGRTIGINECTEQLEPMDKHLSDH